MTFWHCIDLIILCNNFQKGRMSSPREPCLLGLLHIPGCQGQGKATHLNFQGIWTVWLLAGCGGRAGALLFLDIRDIGTIEYEYHCVNGFIGMSWAKPDSKRETDWFSYLFLKCRAGLGGPTACIRSHGKHCCGHPPSLLWATFWWACWKHPIEPGGLQAVSVQWHFHICLLLSSLFWVPGSWSQIFRPGCCRVWDFASLTCRTRSPSSPAGHLGLVLCLRK